MYNFSRQITIFTHWTSFLLSMWNLFLKKSLFAIKNYILKMQMKWTKIFYLFGFLLMPELDFSSNVYLKFYVTTYQNLLLFLWRYHFLALVILKHEISKIGIFFMTHKCFSSKRLLHIPKSLCNDILLKKNCQPYNF